jgi:3-hydroxyisobutyrate dehydrogenase
MQCLLITLLHQQKLLVNYLKQQKKKDLAFLDAPVSGGQAGAENGQLTVMIGGENKDFEKAQDVIKCYSKKMKVLGPAGSGQLAKMVNQICIVGLVQGLSEGIRFGQNAGLNMEDVIEGNIKRRCSILANGK